MTIEEWNEKYVGKFVEYASSKYEVVEIYEMFGAWMVRIYDEPPSKHIDTLNFNNVKWPQNDEG